MRNTCAVNRQAAAVIVAAAVLAWFSPASAAAGEQSMTKTWSVAEFGEPLYDESMEHFPYANTCPPAASTPATRTTAGAREPPRVEDAVESFGEGGRSKTTEGGSKGGAGPPVRS